MIEYFVRCIPSLTNLIDLNCLYNYRLYDYICLKAQLKVCVFPTLSLVSYDFKMAGNGKMSID
jgi:hypothetical protein